MPGLLDKVKRLSKVFGRRSEDKENIPPQSSAESDAQPALQPAPNIQPDTPNNAPPASDGNSSGQQDEHLDPEVKRHLMGWWRTVATTPQAAVDSPRTPPADLAFEPDDAHVRQSQRASMNSDQDIPVDISPEEAGISRSDDDDDVARGVKSVEEDEEDVVRGTSSVEVEEREGSGQEPLLIETPRSADVYLAVNEETGRSFKFIEPHSEEKRDAGRACSV